MPLLRKAPFERAKPPAGLKPNDEVFFCEATKEAFKDYEEFFQRTILCNSLVWSCSVTGKSNLTFEEALESEEKARKRIGNLPKALKRGLLWLAAHTKRGRMGEVTDDVYDYARNRYFKGEIVEAVINDMWCEARISKVIPPTDEEIAADESEDEIMEVDKDGSPKKEKEKVVKFTPADHLFKYEVEETEPDDEDMVELHVVQADDVKREKGMFTREKLSLFLKNAIELEGIHFRVKPKVADLYNLSSLEFDAVFAGPTPQFGESQRKQATVLSRAKKGQFTLDSWIKGEKGEKKSAAPKAPVPEPVKKKKQTPEEIEEEMRRLREAQERHREEVKARMEEAKRKRIEDKAKERERKREEKRIAAELINSWNRRRDDLECEDLKELPKPHAVRCHIPNHLFSEFVSLLEFLNSFSDTLELKNSYPGGLTFAELESALAEQESPDGALYDILTFMLVTLFDLQLEEEEEAKAASDKTAFDDLDKNILGKDEEIANAIKAATDVAGYTKKGLGLSLREVHLDQWSLTEVLRLHLEASGAFRGHNLQNWRYQQRGGFRLSDDPGFQFCRDEPQILGALHSQSVYELSVGDKLKILGCLMNQMLTYAGVRDEIDVRMEAKIEAERELKELTAQEHKRIRDQEKEGKKEKKEDKIKKKVEGLAEAAVGAASGAAAAAAVEPVLTERQREAARHEEEKREKEKQRKEELRRAEFHDKERELQERLFQAQNKVYVHCLGRDRAYRRFWVFDSLPGIFVEHDDDNVGSCLEEVTPWEPTAGPMNEEEATRRAKQILESLGESSDNKENDERLAEACRTYSRQKQKVLAASNGTLAIKGEEDQQQEAKVNGNGTAESCTTEEIPTQPPWGRCEASGDSCPVHSAILPRTHWAFYHSVEDLDALVESLNPRGMREGELRDRLIAEREVLERRLGKRCQTRAWLLKEEEELAEDDRKLAETVTKRREKNAKAAGGAALPLGTSLRDIVELALRDQILEVEEKLYLGGLGNLHVEDRLVWQSAIQTRDYIMGCEELLWGEEGTEIKRLTPDMLLDESRPGSPDGKRSSTGSNSGWNTVVKKLAAAILQVGQMIKEKEKILKSPLGEDEKEKKRRMREEEKRKKKEDAEEEDGIICDDKQESSLTPFQRWEMSLMGSNNMGQLFMHLTTLDNSVLWSKSIMNTKCRLCRRKTDPEKMLLCDGCDRGHHLYCLKPKLKAVPSGDWYCSDCKPKERIRSPKKTVRRVFSSTEEDTEDDYEAEEAASDKEEEDEEEDEVETVSKKKKASKARKNLMEEEEETENTKKGGKKKGGKLANLLGKRRAANEGESKRRREEEEDLEEDSEEEEEAVKRGRDRRSTNKRAKEEENKENAARSKRRRGERDDEIELQFNMSGLEDLIKALFAHRDGWPFDRPITKADAPDYHKIIAKPMDLCTIRSRLNSLQYTCNQEVLDDIRLVFKNCYQYNMEDAEEYQCAVRLEKFFEKEVKKLGLSEETSAPKGKRSRRTL